MKYEKPELEILVWKETDVITDSDGSWTPDGEIGDF